MKSPVQSQTFVVFIVDNQEKSVISLLSSRFRFDDNYKPSYIRPEHLDERLNFVGSYYRVGGAGRQRKEILFLLFLLMNSPFLKKLETINLYMTTLSFLLKK